MPLELSRVSAEFIARTHGRFPEFPGSAWRGAFGRSLRSIVCTTGLSACPLCPRYRECAYPQIFETPSDRDGDGLLRRNEGVPNPYVLAPEWSGPCSVRDGDTVALEVTLIGNAIGLADRIFAALAVAGAGGIGPDRLVLSLAARQPISIETELEMPARLRLTFVTPLRLTETGTLVTAAMLTPRHLLGALVRRASLLAQYHAAGTLDLDFKDLRSRASAAAFVAKDLLWRDWARHSARQGRKIPMGGLVGTAVLPMAGLEPFWPLLRLAPALHIGKGTVMGLGGVTLASAD